MASPIEAEHKWPCMPRWNRGLPQIAVLLSLLALTALAWWALFGLANEMRMPQMVGVEMAAQPWSAGDFAVRLAMWATMMVGMMLPGALPMIMLFRLVAGRLPHAAWRVALFTLAYVVVWSGFSLLATLLQQALERAAWLSPMSMRGTPWLSGLILVSAGVYQWLPIKQACLTQCTSPLNFLLRYPMRTWRDTWRLGLAHGGYCLGCCWALMGVLFAVGVMNLLWAAALGGFVLLEKLIPGPWPARMAGLVLTAWGGLVWLR